jgi:hypothetical protein
MIRVPCPAKVKFVGRRAIVTNTAERSQANQRAHHDMQSEAKAEADARIAAAAFDLGRPLRRSEAAEIRRQVWAANAARKVRQHVA